MACKHPRSETKTYVGSTDTYKFCLDCWETFGGEETPAKKQLIADAAGAGVTEGEECDVLQEG